MRKSVNHSSANVGAMTVEAYCNTPLQTSLPAGWAWKTLGEIAEVVGGGTPMTNDPANFEGGSIPWITPADLSGYTLKKIGHGSRYITKKGLSSSSARLLPAGAVLFTSRAPIGYVAIASNPISTNQGFKSFVLKEGVLPDYVYWYLKGSKDLAESLASGTTFLELSGAKAKQLPIPIAPRAQQKLIVSEIEKQFSRLDEAVVALKRIKANLKRYKASVLKAAVEGKLTEEWRRQNPDVESARELLKHILAERRKKWEKEHPGKKYKEPAAPDTSNLPELPKGWVWATVGQLYDVIGGGTPSTSVPQYWNGDIPWITSADIYGVKDIKPRKQITEKAINSSATNLVPKESLIVVTRVGLGKIAITNTPLCFSQDSQALVGNNSLLFPSYSLYYLFLMPYKDSSMSIGALQ